MLLSTETEPFYTRESWLPHAAKCDRRVLEGQAELRSNVDALARAHHGPGQKPRMGYVAADVERLRREWFRSHDAIDPDEVTGELGSSRRMPFACWRDERSWSPLSPIISIRAITRLLLSSLMVGWPAALLAGSPLEL